MGASLAGLRGHDGDGRKARLAGALLHGGERCLDEVERDHEVDVHHPLDLLHVLLLDLLRHEHALVADEDIDGPGLLQRALHGARVPHVRREDADVCPVAAWMAARASSSRAALRARMETRAPSRAAAVAIASPMPLDPPVMSTWRSVSRTREPRGRARKASAARRPTGGASSSRKRRGDAAMATK
jgi:hypothetical protein